MYLHKICVVQIDFILLIKFVSSLIFKEFQNFISLIVYIKKICCMFRSSQSSSISSNMLDHSYSIYLDIILSTVRFYIFIIGLRKIAVIIEKSSSKFSNNTFWIIHSLCTAKIILNFRNISIFSIRNTFSRFSFYGK